ncbi:MAG: hypothetical protein ACR2RL_00965 [Gammaproteobacteria bacterium]
MSRYRITRRDLPFAREFMESPGGYCSPGLQRVLNLMRTDTANGKYVLVVKEPHRRWLLGRSRCVRGEPVQIVGGYEFDDRLEAERTVFRLRWRDLTGEELEL